MEPCRVGKTGAWVRREVAGMRGLGLGQEAGELLLELFA